MLFNFSENAWYILKITFICKESIINHANKQEIGKKKDEKGEDVTYENQG